MSRHDIANYLGMAPETISRQFKKLQDQGLVSIQNRDLTINDAAALRDSVASGGSDPDSAALC
jgi:CRP/FNR family transcriptional regulator